ncbi:hypothetical protein Mettu_4150 [Methylobacter tundripaludum SV96]|uniref:Uncharacterized protein n=1 Tax=Methylobacter tundripaludum (strain ATCC BAA-1195 / DSM 17260 / SV96) TaxID=697282 RepID=G3J1C5_METTV|nr:hypothetical protein Mettu_4150 [Methylobacter tundripaludum SV96]
MCILFSRCAGFIDNKRIDVLADMILSPLGFVLTFILRHTGICGTLARGTPYHLPAVTKS